MLSWKQKFAVFGNYFGYPNCCVVAFIEETDCVVTLMNRPIRKLDGTGFVPCQECSDKHSEEELINIINEKRRHNEPFSKDI